MNNENKDRQRRKVERPQPDDAEDSEELAHYDDAVIGRAFRWSLVALIVIVLGTGMVIYIMKRKPQKGSPKLTALTAPVVRRSAPVEIPKVKFTEITADAGIKFVHNNGAYGDKLLPETMGGGV